jgi:D-alanyl-D-alanine carboxypeptidase (penicillin-binding protein 5/6)
MTALLALERAQPDDRFAAPLYRPLPAESQIGLRRGERMSVADLLRALLLESANDAAVTIARGVSGSRASFVAAMNERARELGLDDTHYANPIGLDDPDNYSTARDLADLARRLLRDRRFARIVSLSSATLATGGHRRTVRNRNALVSSTRIVDGVKTGHTVAAGDVLVGSATGPQGLRIVSVVLGEPSEAARDADTLALLRYGLSQFKRVQALDTADPVASAEIRYHGDRRADLVPKSDFFTVVRRGERLRTRVEAPERLDGPLPSGSRVGSVTVLYRGRPLRTVPLVTAADVPGAGPLRIVFSTLGVPLTLILGLGTLGVLALAGLRARTVYNRRHRQSAT